MIMRFKFIYRVFVIMYKSETLINICMLYFVFCICVINSEKLLFQPPSYSVAHYRIYEKRF